MSRKTSTKFLTSLAALAFDTVLRNGLINLISPPSSKKQNYTHNQSIVASVTASGVHSSWLHNSTAINRASDISRENKQNLAGFSGANLGKNQPISRDFRGKKFKIRGKIGRFCRIFAGRKSKFAEKSADFAGF